jgi:hypothetical protein
MAGYPLAVQRHPQRAESQLLFPAPGWLRRNPVASACDVGQAGGVTGTPLLQPVPPGGDWRNTVIIGGASEDDSILAQGFLDAADILVEHWKNHRPDDTLVLPILNNYRHGIELGLKVAIRDAAARLREDGAADTDLQPSALDDELSRTHSIGDLVRKLNACLGRLQLGPDSQLPADTMDVLESLHALDESGQALRYSTIKTGRGNARRLVPARAAEQQFDLESVAAALSDAGTLVADGISGVLEQYAESQQAMRGS